MAVYSTIKATYVASSGTTASTNIARDPSKIRMSHHLPTVRTETSGRFSGLLVPLCPYPGAYTPGPGGGATGASLRVNTRDIPFGKVW